MCQEYFVLVTFKKDKVDKVYAGDLESHFGIALAYGLEPGSYYEAEWTEDDKGESLTIRSKDKDPSWLKSIFLEKYPTRKDLLKTIKEGKKKDNDGGLVEYHFRNGKLQDPNPTTPAKRFYYESGKVWIEVYFQEGKRQDPNPTTPAWRSYHENGKVSTEGYYQKGKEQDPNPTTPAYRSYYRNGKLSTEEYYQEGKLQDPSPTTPACRSFHLDGNILLENHWQNGVHISCKETKMLYIGKNMLNNEIYIVGKNADKIRIAYDEVSICDCLCNEEVCICPETERTYSQWFDIFFGQQRIGSGEIKWFGYNPVEQTHEIYELAQGYGVLSVDKTLNKETVFEPDLLLCPTIVAGENDTGGSLT